MLPGRARARRRGRRRSASTPCAAEVAERALDGRGARSSTTSAAAWPTPAMAGAGRRAGVPYVAMHWRGHVRPDGRSWPVRRRRRRRPRRAGRAGRRARRRRRRPRAAGARPRARLRQARRAQLGAAGPARRAGALGRRVLVGASRKRFLGALLAGPTARPDPPTERDAATAATSALAAAAGAWCVRVHDVARPRARRRRRPSRPSAGAGRDAARERGAPSDRRRPLDQVALRGLACAAPRGATTPSATPGQEFVVDVVAARSTPRAAAAGDDLAGTVHYGELAEQVAAVVAGEPVDLIETLAERIADVALGPSPRSTRSTVTVHKPQAPVDGARSTTSSVGPSGGGGRDGSGRSALAPPSCGRPRPGRQPRRPAATLRAAVRRAGGTPGLTCARRPAGGDRPGRRPGAAGLPQRRRARRDDALARASCWPPATASRPGTAASGSCAGGPGPSTSTSSPTASRGRPPRWSATRPS